MRAPHILLIAPLVFAGVSSVTISVAAQEVVQALPNPAAAQLAQAMQRLSSNPNSVAALVDAGRASLDLDDVDAALGFFSRAQRSAPEDGRVLSGLALVALRRGDGVTALQLFDNANLAGEPMAPLAAERGLAYDLVGNNARAQRLYRQALGRTASPEVSRRLALSYAISGDQAASEEVLLPLLDRQDRAAFRSRAFALAILGREEEAVTIADTMLPARLATRMEPYLRYMGRLTRAQQAAAANLGRFPAASQIGREDPRMAAIGIASPEPVSAPREIASVDERLIPSGEPLARSEPIEQPAQIAELPPEVVAPLPPEEETVLAAVAVVQELPPQEVAESPAEIAVLQEAPEIETEVPTPAQSSQMPAQVSELPALASAEPAGLRPEVDTPVEDTPAVNTVVTTVQPSFSLTDVAASAPPEPAAETPAELIDLAEAFAEFADADSVPVAPVANAVDITAIDIPRERPEPEISQPQTPAPPENPSRQWVQIATGQDIAAFRYDWRRFRRGADGLLDDRGAFHAQWGQTNRLLTGPFETAREAQQFVTSLGEAGIDSFRFTSADGQKVTPLE